ncbi:galactokinase [Streptomyces sp. NPDC056411]|uniref:galactokinase n=1 Tax=Streptomyces sp. NPDC056411 TaxID=3345813 RepID=UPI0035D5F835
MTAADLARRPTADPLQRLLAHGFAAAYGRPPETVWRAPYAFHLGAHAVPRSPALTGIVPGTDWVAAADRHTGAAVAPRTDGMLRCGSLNHPAESAALPLLGPAARAPGWAARPYAALRALAAAGVGRGGADLQVNAALPDEAGLPVAEPLECAAALAVADLHAHRGGAPVPRARLARLLGTAVPGDDALRRAVLFARAGHLLAVDGGTHRPLRGDRSGADPGLLLLTLRAPAGPPPHPDTAAGGVATALALSEALRAGAWSAWWPARRPGRGLLLLMPRERRAAVRAAVADAFTRAALPVPRCVRIAAGDAAHREH